MTTKKSKWKNVIHTKPTTNKNSLLLRKSLWKIGRVLSRIKSWIRKGSKKNTWPKNKALIKLTKKWKTRNKGLKKSSEFVGNKS
jgi:hypothetical protein